MRSTHEDDKNERIRVELKYCEHCGGLWLRECGAGVVYCPNCQPKVADLPVGKKKPRRVTLPLGRRSLVEEYDVEGDQSEDDLEAAGGAA